MDWVTAFGPDSTPQADEIDSFVNSPLLGAFKAHIEKQYDAKSEIQYSRCSAQPGWNIKYKKGSRPLTTIYPMDGYFIALVTIGAKAEAEVSLLIPLLSEYTQALYERTTSAPRMGRWLMLEVRNEQVLNDTIKLIAAKLTAK